MFNSVPVVLGINYGNNIITGPSYGGGFNTSQVTSDAKRLWDFGFRKVRIGIYKFNDTTAKANSRAAALIFKQQGFYVIHGCGAGGTTITASNFSTGFGAECQIAAAWAEENEMDEFQSGNEELLHIDEDTIVYDQLWSDYMKPLATTLQGIFTRGPISYAEVQGLGETSPTGWWNANGKGDFDFIGFNVYGDDSGTFEEMVQFQIDNFNSGSDTNIYEWNNKQSDITLLFNNKISEEENAQRLKSKFNYIKTNVGESDPLFTCYLFTYRWDQSADTKAFWFVENQSNLHRPAWNEIVGGRYQSSGLG